MGAGGGLCEAMRALSHPTAQPNFCGVLCREVILSELLLSILFFFFKIILYFVIAVIL